MDTRQALSNQYAETLQSLGANEQETRILAPLMADAEMELENKRRRPFQVARLAIGGQGLIVLGEQDWAHNELRQLVSAAFMLVDQKPKMSQD